MNEQREREGNFGDALRDLVRLARMNNINRENIREVEMERQRERPS